MHSKLIALALFVVGWLTLAAALWGVWRPGVALMGAALVTYAALADFDDGRKR